MLLQMIRTAVDSEHPGLLGADKLKMQRQYESQVSVLAAVMDLCMMVPAKSRYFRNLGTPHTSACEKCGT